MFNMFPLSLRLGLTRYTKLGVRRLSTTMVAVLLCGLLGGCGWVDRVTASATGAPSEACVDGVSYLQFTSGVSVKYTPQGRVATCGVK